MSSESVTVALSVFPSYVPEDLEGYVAFFGDPWIILSSTKPNIQGKWFLSKQWVQSNEKEMENGFWIQTKSLCLFSFPNKNEFNFYYTQQLEI